MGTDARLARMLEERYPDPTVSAAHLDRGTEISIGPARPWSRVEEEETWSSPRTTSWVPTPS